MTAAPRDSHLTYPPLDYSVTLAEVVDFQAQNNPSETVWTFAEDGKTAPTDISYLEFAHAVHRVAHYVRPGRSGPDGETIAFVALTDSLLYQAITLGIIRAGYIPFPMSPRNTAAAIYKLMKDTACHRLLTTQQTLRALVDDVRGLAGADYALTVDEVPAVAAIFPQLGSAEVEEGFEAYPTGVRRPITSTVLYLHSSGSTGLPKTIPQTFITMVDWANSDYVKGLRRLDVPLKVSGHALPPFHTLAIICQVHAALYAMSPVGLYPPVATAPGLLPVIPTPQNILEHVRRSACNALVTIPTLLQVWSHDKEATAFLASLDWVTFSGGSLPTKVGNLLTSAGVRILSAYGGTEFGSPGLFFHSKEDEDEWEYNDFPDKRVFSFDPQGDGTYELQMMTTEYYHVSVENIPGVKGYATSDLFVPHPTKSHLWKLVGRKDDVIIHTSGEKTVPGPMEDILMSSPYITGAIVFGRERDQAGVLFELKPAYQFDTHDDEALENARNTLWPVVDEANKNAPAFSRIFKEMILFTSSSKPLPRAGKGTVMRKASLEVYKDEIDELYAQVQATANLEAIVPPPSWDVEELSVWLSTQISELTMNTSISRTGDLFEQGMDSLSTTILRRRLVGALEATNVAKANQVIEYGTIYENPTVQKLATFISNAVKDPNSSTTKLSKADIMDAMIAKYTAGLDKSVTPASKKNTGSLVVLLTGSTGNLGSQMLETLLRDSEVKTVYVLNRPSSGSKSSQQRQAERFADKELDASLLSSDRLVYLEGDASHSNLGLDDAVYNKLRSTVTTIIHNAWRLDFNLSLSSFEPNVQGTRNLVDLARSSDHATKLLFTSSVSSATSWDKQKGPYPEEVVNESKYASGNGYGESKYVAERILEASGIQSTSFRIGQISGSRTNGSWATSDWVPILVKSSIHLNALPSMPGVISWIPMDSVAETIVEVAKSSGESPPALNIVHPRPVSWSAIVSSINEALVEEGVVPAVLPVVDMNTWVSKLIEHRDNPSPEIMANLPAIKLIDFFTSSGGGSASENEEVGGLTSFSTDKARAASNALRSLSEIGSEDARRWVKYWKSVSFI